MIEGSNARGDHTPLHGQVQAALPRLLPGFLSQPTRHLFFTGKGGVGKTSLSTAAALTLADAGKKVLLVSTDAASNLDEMLGIELRNTPTPVPGAPGLSVLNIDPDTAAEAYRRRVLAQMGVGASTAEIATVREQLSGACTTEIASFDEFASLLSDGADHFDHIVFDTAPTGHTLRLLSLPKAWGGFLAGNDRGASCLGPHSGLKMQEVRFTAALDALSDHARTTVILVTRPDKGDIAEAARISEELHALGLNNQRLAINGVFHASERTDAVAGAIEALGQQALAEMPASLCALPQDRVPLRAFDTVGLPALRALLAAGAAPTAPGRDEAVEPTTDHFSGLDALADELATAGHGLIMVMGKGGVGKTTVAAALALGLVQRGKTVRLSTTDPAAHLAATLDGDVPGLRVDRIDPKVETRCYIDKIMAAKSPGLDAQEQALLLEDLRSPCTEEVAVFHAFSRVVSEGRSAFVVLDTAPTGHSLLLMDASGAYHRQMLREFEGHGAGRVVTPLMRLQDAAYTKIILVTLPEATPVSQAAALQNDLHRAGIEPYAWVLNKSVLAAGTRDPLLAARLAGERKQMERMSGGLVKRAFIIPWLTRPPIGFAELCALVVKNSAWRPMHRSVRQRTDKRARQHQDDSRMNRSQSHGTHHAQRPHHGASHLPRECGTSGQHSTGALSGGAIRRAIGRHRLGRQRPEVRRSFHGGHGRRRELRPPCAARLTATLASPHLGLHRMIASTSALRSAVAVVLGALAPMLPACAESRGELLYATHCIACHTTEMHWRDNRVATDWPSLKAQVRRWQGAASLAWTDRDILEVTRHLNESIYRFKQTEDPQTSIGPATTAPGPAMPRQSPLEPTRPYTRQDQAQAPWAHFGKGRLRSAGRSADLSSLRAL